MPLLKQFCHWAEANGVRTSLVPKESQGMGIGLFVTSDDKGHQIGDQGELAFVPASLIISRSHILLLDYPCLQTTFGIIGLESITERIAIIIFLLYERHLLEQRRCAPSMSASPDISSQNAGPVLDSIFADYIAVLPDVRTPVTLDPETARGYLAGTLLLDSVCAKRTKLETEYELLSGKLGVFEHWPVHPTLDSFIWADATFWSRVLSFGSQWAKEDSKRENEQYHDQRQDNSHGQEAYNKLSTDDDLHMVPLLDFANHAAEPNIRWQAEADGLRKVPKTDTAFLLLLFRFLYGFTLQDNPTQFLTLAMPMDEDDPFYMPKAHTLMRLGIPPRITIYLDKSDGPDDLVELCQGLWITPESQYLLWIYGLNEEDGLGAMIEEPEVKICTPHKAVDEGEEETMEEADLIDEDTVGRLILTIQGTQIVTKASVQTTVPKLEVYPVLVLRALVLVADRVEYYVNRIMETGDKVQRVEGVEIVRAINYEGDVQKDAEDAYPPAESSRIPATTRLGRSIGDCLLPTLLEPDHEHPITTRQLEIETQVSNLVATMKSYRIEELALLVQIGNLLGEAQTHCVDESAFIQQYLARMQNQDSSE
ncbi:hypothetical protein BGX28_000402 [Mortierella sp. GBA30]|nr:hypothetical protein BGX28_000402 [Mortierella sp. GBA30]